MRNKIVVSNNNGVEIFNVLLTPCNAMALGYKYLEDVVYNVIAPTRAKKDILQLVYEKGYKLGSPLKENKPCYGLYAPLN